MGLGGEKVALGEKDPCVVMNGEKKLVGSPRKDRVELRYWGRETSLNGGKRKKKKKRCLSD